MLKIITECKNPSILVITPLLDGRKISKETKVSIKRNDTPYIWASHTSKEKHAKNVQLGINAFKKEFRYLPQYIQILDDDITLGRYMIDRLFNVLDKTSDDIGYAYCGLEYKGHVNIKIPVVDFNIERLKMKNYISSNSLYKTEMLYKVGGLVTELEYHRLSDWAFFLKSYKLGYKGVYVSNTSFIAKSTPSDISAGSDEEHYITKRLVTEKFVSTL